jgi:hypothetical protein
MSDYSIEVLFSFDTTGSMYPCLTQVRRKVKETVTRLLSEIPGMRIGIIAHGDYCDKGSSYVTKHFKLTDDAAAICKFVQEVGPTGGGDLPECYELVLREAQSFNWIKSTRKLLVMIGDDVPHGPKDNPGHLNWRDEVDKLAGLGIPVHGVQCLNRKHATKFYEELAHKSGGFHISLDQFSYVTDMIMAVCFKQSSDAQLQSFEQEVIKEGRMSRGLNKMFDSISKRKPSATFEPADLRAVPPGRFQVLDIDRDCAIKDFVLENGLTFKKGRGFYEFTKTETIQEYKEIVLMDRKTGDLFAGAAAREMLGLPESGSARIKPTSLEKYVDFVQSTSVNRKLIGKTKFLYEVDDWSAD